MIILAWCMVAVWALALLASAKIPLAPLPPAIRHVPQYQLWLDGGEIPPLDPPPAQVHVGAAPPTNGPRWVLRLSGGAQPRPELPRHLAACEAPFVSVFPAPRGGLLGQAIERLRRDFAGPQKVTNPAEAAGYADDRCVWMRLDDLRLPGSGEISDHQLPGLWVARARKAHGLAVDLRRAEADVGGGRLSPPRLEAPALSLSAHLRSYVELVEGDHVIWALMAGVPPLLVALTLIPLCSAEARLTVALAVCLGALARLMVCARDRFGYGLILAGWILEPTLALASLRRQPPAPTPPPIPPRLAAPTLTGGRREAPSDHWMDRAAVPMLARRLGGAAPVMEAIYANQPRGVGWRGRALDRVVLASVGARAVRHRWWAVVQRGRRRAPQSVLSVPAGGGRDAAALGAARLVLVDPDPAARALCAQVAPNAEILNATVETAPEGPFDLILYVGLIEYLDDETIIHHLSHLRGRLAPGGAIMVTTTQDHPELEKMRRWLGWTTKGRSAQALIRLLDEAGLTPLEVHTDPMEVQALITAAPRGAEGAEGA